MSGTRLEMPVSDANREAHSGPAVLHDLKNRARTLCSTGDTMDERGVSEWTQDLDRFFAFALGCCRRDEDEGIGSPGDSAELERRLAPYRDVVADAAAKRAAPARDAIEKIWRFLQAEESDRGALFRSIADETMSDKEGLATAPVSSPIVRALVKVLAALLPPSYCTHDGKLALSPSRADMIEVLWACGHGSFATGIMLPAAVLDAAMRKMLKRIDGATILDPTRTC